MACQNPCILTVSNNISGFVLCFYFLLGILITTHNWFQTTVAAHSLFHLQVRIMSQSWHDLGYCNPEGIYV